MQQVADIARGGYVLSRSAGHDFAADPDRHRFGSGTGDGGRARSSAQQDGRARGVDAVHRRVRRQDAEYREGVLPNGAARASRSKPASRDFWRKYVGLDGEVVGMTTFGASAPAAQLFEHFGITVTAVIDAAKRVNR